MRGDVRDDVLDVHARVGDGGFGVGRERACFFKELHAELAGVPRRDVEVERVAVRQGAVRGDGHHRGLALLLRVRGLAELDYVYVRGAATRRRDETKKGSRASEREGHDCRLPIVACFSRRRLARFARENRADVPFTHACLEPSTSPVVALTTAGEVRGWMGGEVSLGAGGAGAA